MNTPTPTQFLCVRIDTSKIPNVIPEDDDFRSSIFTLVLNAALRGRGVLVKDFSLRDEGHVNTQFSGGVITRQNESIGLFVVTDWVSAANALCSELDALKLLPFSIVGRNFEDGGPWLPIFPTDSKEDFNAISRRYIKWQSELPPKLPQWPSL